jgi:transcriptional regulator with XRE-family HTH domain
MRLAAMLKLYMRVNEIGTRELARKLDMSPATLSRIVNGKNSEMRNFVKLFVWLLETESE